jgi:formate hydrogenlyase transcriptional activator
VLRLTCFPNRAPFTTIIRREGGSIRYFVQKFARRMNKQIETITSDTMKALMNWHWPGNVRELENLIERPVILTQGTVLRPPLAELRTDAETSREVATLEAAEREHIARVLRDTRELFQACTERQPGSV